MAALSSVWAVGVLRARMLDAYCVYANAGDSDDEAGPAPPPGVDKPKKKRKVLEFQHVYLDNLPCAGMYERSYMHQNTVTHVLFTKNNFLVTASSEGHIKFWKKKHGEIEFIKRYMAHMGPVTALSASLDGFVFWK